MDADVILDACGGRISCALINRLIADLKAKCLTLPPVQEWLIISSTRQFNYFAALWEPPAPSGTVEVIEGVASMPVEISIPIEVKYAGVRWLMDDRIPLELVRIEAGKKACGVIQNLELWG